MCIVRTLGLVTNASVLLRPNQALVVGYLKFRTNWMPLGNQELHLNLLIVVILITWTSVEQILQKLIF
jgi:hypothetical protein